MHRHTRRRTPTPTHVNTHLTPTPRLPTPHHACVWVGIGVLGGWVGVGGRVWVNAYVWVCACTGRACTLKECVMTASGRRTCTRSAHIHDTTCECLVFLLYGRWRNVAVCALCVLQPTS